MRPLAALFLITLPAALAAQSPQQFERTFVLGLDGAEGLYEVELPPAAYEGAVRPDLGDLRVFNGAGEVVPHAFRPRVTDTTEKRPATPVSLALFPIHGDAERGVTDSGFRLERSGDRIVVELRSHSPQPVAERKLIGYVADAAAIGRPLRALAFALPAEAGEVLGRVRIEASDDLAHWTTVRDAQVVRLVSAGQRLEQLRVKFPALRTKYLRVSWPGRRQPIELAGITVESGESAVRVEASRSWRQVAGVALGDRPGEYEFDLGGQFPVDRVRLALPQQNTVVPVELLARSRPGEAWRPVGGGVAYRLHRDGIELTSPDLAVATVTDRHWLLRVDQRGGGLGAASRCSTRAGCRSAWCSSRAATDRSSSPSEAATRNPPATRLRRWCRATSPTPNSSCGAPRSSGRSPRGPRSRRRDRRSAGRSRASGSAGCSGAVSFSASRCSVPSPWVSRGRWRGRERAQRTPGATSASEAPQRVLRRLPARSRGGAARLRRGRLPRAAPWTGRARFLAPAAPPPRVADEALPAALLLRERIAGFPGGAIALDALLHLLVDLADRQAAGAFQLVGIVVRHGCRAGKSADSPMLNSIAPLRGTVRCQETPSASCSA